VSIDFANAIRDAGYEPPEVIEAGKFHRFAGYDKKPSNKAGWCRLFEDLQGGVYGDFSTGLEGTWHIKREKPYSAAEKKQFRRQVSETRIKAKSRLKIVRADAAKKAGQIWQRSTSASATHPYLVRKSVSAYGIRCYKKCLIVPLHDGDAIRSLQFIMPDGTKRFLSGSQTQGCYYFIGTPTDTLYLCEGLATAASIHEATGIATAVAFTANNLKAVAGSLQRKHNNTKIIVAGDNDESGVGQKYAMEAAKAISGSVTIPPEKGDWNDYSALFGLSALRQSIAKEIVELDSEHDAVISQLSGLRSIDYEIQRKAAAQKLGIRTSVLDAEVQGSRKLHEKEATDLFPDIEPWPEEVCGAELLESLSESARQFLTLQPHTDVALPLWVLFTHLIDTAEHSPILAITAPEKRCGKTTVLGWLSRLVAKPLSASNMTTAVVFRVVEKWHPTLLIDEADTFIRNSDELRGVLNSGHSRETAYVLRTVGDDYDPKRFSTWSAKAIAMIGQLPDTLADRSINIEMRRKLTHETVSKIRDAREHLSGLQRKCVRFAIDNIEAISKARPGAPTSLNDRAVDNWAPLFAIADIAGGDWPEKARAAAIAISGIESEGASVNVELLQDIKFAFERQKETRMKTADLLLELCRDEESPWRTWNRGKPLNGQQLAERLKTFKIVPQQIWWSNKINRRGYEAKQFTDVWLRYLPASPIEATADKGFEHIQSARTATNLAGNSQPDASTHTGSSTLAENNPIAKSNQN